MKYRTMSEQRTCHQTALVVPFQRKARDGKALPEPCVKQRSYALQHYGRLLRHTCLPDHVCSLLHGRHGLFKMREPLFSSPRVVLSDSVVLSYTDRAV